MSNGPGPEPDLIRQATVACFERAFVQLRVQLSRHAPNEMLDLLRDRTGRVPVAVLKPHVNLMLAAFGYPPDDDANSNSPTSQAIRGIRRRGRAASPAV